MAHPFFLSYARKDSLIDGDPKRPDPHFETFVQRLQMRVDQLMGTQGFVDRSSILAGQEWPDEIAEALRTAQTIVSLYSPSYFRSEYCGKEMQILLDRRRQYMRESVGKRPANIIPVLWHPSPGRIPRTLPEIQYQAPSLDPRTKGAWNLGDEGRDRELKDFADQIAIRIRDAADEAKLPELLYRPRMNIVQSAFCPQPLPLPEFDSMNTVAGPTSVTFVYASATRWSAWPWAPPEDQAVLYLSSAVAKGKEMEANQLTFDVEHSDLVERLEIVRQRNNVVIVLVDAASLALDDLRVRMQEYDRQQYSRFATIVIWRSTRVDDLEKQVNDTFRYCAKRPPPYFHSLEDRDHFSDLVSRTIETLRIEIANNPHEPKFIRKTTDFPSLPAVTGPGPQQGI